MPRRRKARSPGAEAMPKALEIQKRRTLRFAVDCLSRHERELGHEKRFRAGLERRFSLFRPGTDKVFTFHREPPGTQERQPMEWSRSSFVITHTMRQHGLVST